MSVPAHLRRHGVRAAWRSLEERGPVVVGVPAVVVLGLAFWAFSVEAPRSSIAARLYASLDLFAGNYISLEGQAEEPSPLVAVLGFLALTLTFTAALTAVLSLTARARERFRAGRAGHQLVVIGSGTAAAEILRGHQASPKGAMLLVTDSRQATAAVAARGQAPVWVADLDALTDEDADSLRGRGGRIAVATEDDPRNLELAQRLASRASGGAVTAIIGHAFLVDELRPALIRGGLQMGYGISCPIEKVAERVCHHLDHALSGNPHLRAAGRGSVVVEGDGGQSARTVELWVRRFTWSRSFLHDGMPDQVPLLRMVDELATDHEGPTFRVFVGENLADTAARTLRGLRTRGPRDQGFISVTRESLLPLSDTLPVPVVDPRSAAWDPQLLFDDMEKQWGRLYHAIYGLRFNKMTEWSEVSSGREGQSSIAAGRFMLQNLETHGFHLVKCQQPPAAPDFTHSEVTSMAAAEHDQWLRHRTYVDERGHSVSVARSDSPYRVPWEQLDEEKRRDNEELVVRTVPALAAVFGYEVQRFSTEPARAQASAGH